MKVSVAQRGGSNVVITMSTQSGCICIQYPAATTIREVYLRYNTALTCLKRDRTYCDNEITVNDTSACLSLRETGTLRVVRVHNVDDARDILYSIVNGLGHYVVTQHLQQHAERSRYTAAPFDFETKTY